MFATSRAVLEGKARHLRDHGKGQRPNKTSSIDFDEEEKLWQCEQLGSKTPMSLINTYSESGFGRYRVSEGVTKTRQSGLHEKHRQKCLLLIPRDVQLLSTNCTLENCIV